MDWERQHLDWSDQDFGNFRYGDGESIIIRKLASDETPCISKLDSPSKWKDWLNKEQCLSRDQAKPGLLLIVCSRAKRLRVGPAPVSHLPFEIAVFSKLVDKFGLHPTIGRTIQRQAPYFAAQYFSESHPLGSMFTYTARTSSIIAGDIAISATHFPQHRFNVGVIYGCDEKQMEQFTKRVRNGMDSLQHPMFLPGIFAETERVRLSRIIDKMLDDFTLQSSRAGTNDVLDTRMELKPKLVSFLEISYQSQDLINIMKSTRRQLLKMITETDRGTRVATGRKLKLVNMEVARSSAESVARIKLTGERIRTRLREMLDEYDEKINECGMVVNNMSLTMQTLWNHFAREENQVNIQISSINTGLARVNSQMTTDMKRDSSQMRSIALLTMVFLPMTAVASIFSTTIFVWDPDQKKTIFSGYLWVFVVLTTILTVITVSAWYWWTHGLPWNRRDEGNKEAAKIEEGMGTLRNHVAGAFNVP